MNLIRHVEDQCWDVLQQVSDPEIPVLSVIDLGMIRGVELNQQDEIVVRLTPTYSGCPATDLLKAEITQAFEANGLTPVKVIVDLSQAWTTDWMSESGKHKLQQYGIAPPQGQSHSCGTHVALTDGIKGYQRRAWVTVFKLAFSSEAVHIHERLVCMEYF